MATTQPAPPMGTPLPPPPRPKSNILAIALLVFGIVVVLAAVGVLTGLHYLARGVQLHVAGSDDHKQVSIHTPFGGLEVNKNGGVNEVALGLPQYPGATQAQNEDSATVTLGFPGDEGLRIVAGKFDTPDSLETVRAFYSKRLTAREGAFTEKSDIDWDHGNTSLDNGEMGNFTGSGRENNTVFKIKHPGDERVVNLKRQGDGTRIELVRVSKRGGDSASNDGGEPN